MPSVREMWNLSLLAWVLASLDLLDTGGRGKLVWMVCTVQYCGKV